MNDIVSVTGATGLIGKELCALLGARGARFRALVRRADRAPSIAGAEGIVVGCVSDAQAMLELCKGSRAVVHLARSTHRLEDLCRFDYMALSTILPAVNANAAALHFASSQAVFGNVRSIPPAILTDDAPRAPTTAYGAMKAAWESTAIAACRPPPTIYRLPVVIPGDIRAGAEWLRHLLFHGFGRLDPTRRRLELRPSDSRFARGGVSFVHVEDVAETIAHNLFRAEAHGTVATLADPDHVPFQELASLYADAAGQLGIATHHDWADAPANGPAHRDTMFRFDCSLAVAKLGFRSVNGKARLFDKLTRWFTHLARSPG
jgi:nucleoside-diphosphate-sugar epimerase